MMRVLSILLVAIAAPSTSAIPAAPFSVDETGKRFQRLDEAVASLEGGDGTIRVQPGRYADCAVQTGGHLHLMATRRGTVTFDGGICEGKATLVLRGARAVVEGITFTHTSVPDGNGAGIRIEHGDLQVAYCSFIDGQSGILSALDPWASISIDHSTFSGLGKDPTGTGAHAIYVGGYRSLAISNSRFERGRGGHYVKSRAPRISVIDSSFDDSSGIDTNYMIDLSNGATGLIARNTFVSGPNQQNHTTMITVAPEGVVNRSAGLIVEDNTAGLAPGVEWRTDLVGDWSGEPIVVRRNHVDGRVTEFATRRVSASLHKAKSLARYAFDGVRSALGY